MGGRCEWRRNTIGSMGIACGEIAEHLGVHEVTVESTSHAQNRGLSE